jgi:hypothetical protein
MFKIEGL